MKKASQISKNKSEDRRSGSVLVAVLAMIMLLSFLIIQFMNESLEDLEYRAIFNEPTDLRAQAYSLLEVSLATVQEVALIEDGKLYAPEQGWKDPIGYAEIEIPHGWTVSIEIQDESGKLPINTMSERLLNKLFEETFDFDFGTSRQLSSSLLDWIDADESRRLNGAESEDYLGRDPPYRAANGPLQTLDELRLLETWDEHFFDEEGRPNEAFQLLSSIASVYTSGAVNLNSVPQPTLDLLALDSGFDSDFVFDGLDQPYLTTLPASADESYSGVEVRLLRVTITLLRGEIPFTISALVEPNFTSGASGSLSREKDGDDSLRTGTAEEQNAIKYPFTILHLSEYYANEKNTAELARYSSVDIQDD